MSAVFPQEDIHQCSAKLGEGSLVVAKSRQRELCVEVLFLVPAQQQVPFLIIRLDEKIAPRIPRLKTLATG